MNAQPITASAIATSRRRRDRIHSCSAVTALAVGFGRQEIGQQRNLDESEGHHVERDQHGHLGQRGGPRGQDDGERGQVVDRRQGDGEPGDPGDRERITLQQLGRRPRQFRRPRAQPAEEVDGDDRGDDQHQQPDQELNPGDGDEGRSEQDAPEHKQDNQAHRRSHGETTAQKRE